MHIDPNFQKAIKDHIAGCPVVDTLSIDGVVHKVYDTSKHNIPNIMIPSWLGI